MTAAGFPANRRVVKASSWNIGARNAGRPGLFFIGHAAAAAVPGYAIAARARRGNSPAVPSAWRANTRLSAALRLTTAKYYTPSKQVIHEKGITPNIKASLTADQERALLLRHRDGLLSPEEQKFVDDQKDPQLDRALDALKGAMIYNQNDKQPQATQQ